VAARSKARKRALDLMYAAEMRGRPVVEELAEVAAHRTPGDPVNPYTEQLVRGVSDHAARIDEVIATYAEGWTLARMPAVDRNVLRIGVYELLWGDDDVPDTVAVSEALHLVQDLSTDDSPAFVNGVLGQIQHDKADLAG
jgi:N utilization substance protein B